VNISLVILCCKDVGYYTFIVLVLSGTESNLDSE
jgi:hypothetical protein